MSAMPQLWSPEPWTVPPAYFKHPEFDYSAGYRIADFVAGLTLDGVPFVPDVNQRNLLAATFAGPPGASYQTRGLKWTAPTVSVIVARQNVKTSFAFQAVTGAVLLLDAMKVTWSAHVFNPTTKEAFEDFQKLIDENPAVARRVKSVHTASGREEIKFRNGAKIRFLARSKGAGRGTGSDVIVLDEAYALTPAEVGALVPTKSARPNPHIFYLSSAGRLESEQLRTIRNSGRAGAPRTLYAEWCGRSAMAEPELACVEVRCSHEPGVPGCVLDDRDEWRRANPALGLRLDWETLEDERNQMTPAEFARERVGWWEESRAGRVIPMGRWAAAATDADIAGPITVFVDIALDRSASVVAVCGHDGDEFAQVQIADGSPGTGWVLDRVAGILDRHDVLAVGARSAGPVASLLAELAGLAEEQRVEFVKVGSSDFAGMCGGFYDAVVSGNMRHRNDDRVRQALESAKRHQVLDAWTWERTAVDVDAAPLVAVTGALGLFTRFGRVSVDYRAADSVW